LSNEPYLNSIFFDKNSLKTFDSTHLIDLRKLCILKKVILKNRPEKNNSWLSGKPGKVSKLFLSPQNILIYLFLQESLFFFVLLELF